MKKKTGIPFFGDLLAVSAIIVILAILTFTFHWTQVVTEYFYKYRDYPLNELLINLTAASILLSVSFLWRTGKHNKYIIVQREIEEKLSASQQQMEMILNNSATILYTATPFTHTTTYISANVTSILGYMPEDFYQSDFWLTIIHEDEVREIVAVTPSFYEKGLWENEFRIKHKNGNWMWIVNRIQVVRDENGAPKELVGSWLDITERKEARESIRKTEERFQLASRATKDIIYDWNLQTNNIWFSDEIFQSFGYKKDQDIINLDWWAKKVHPEDHDRALSSAREILEQKLDSRSSEYRFQKADGSYAFIFDRGFIVYSEKNIPLRWVGSMSDVSVIKEIESELRQAKEKAEESTHAKSEFLANMSHEIRTPLNGIVGMTDMVLESELTIEQRRSLEIIESSSETLLFIINDILDFSKIEAGKLELSPTAFSMRDEIPKGLQALGLKASEKNLEFIFRLQQNVPDLFIGDVQRLQQIITNLAGNAIKFTEKGEVILRVQLQSLLNDEATLHFTVSDSGIGIPAGKLSAVFEEFTQADNSTSRRFGGTGLGLAISKKLVELMGGTIWAESTEGEGSSFHFTIKLKLQAENNQPRFVPTPVPDGIPVLIVQHNKTACHHLQEILVHFGMKCTAVNTGEEALAELKRGLQRQLPYRVLLLDTDLPGALDGFDVASILFQQEEVYDINIIILSMSQKASDRKRFARLGVTNFISKPFSQSDLLDRIASTLNENKPILREEYLDMKTQQPDAKPFLQNGALKILLAEDNRVNQEVAKSMLTKLGHTVTISSNGDEAIAAVLKESFDLVLMDVQMPLKNGYEATQKIRETEKQSGLHTTIIGLTANAMKGDREKCLQAGMDDYMTKPLRLKELTKKISGVKSEQKITAFAKAEYSLSSEPVIDLETLQEKLDHDKEQLAMISDLFQTESSGLLQALEQGFNNENPEKIEEACHVLKGSFITLEMPVAFTITRQMEILAGESKFQEAKHLFPLLKNNIMQALDCLKKLCA